jgi:prevent-host-death family protein
MRMVTDRDLRNVPGKVREALNQGEVVVTSRGRPYAVLMPVEDPARLEEVLALAARVRTQMAVSAARRKAVLAGLDRLGDAEIDAEIARARAERQP